MNADELSKLADWLEEGGAGADFNRFADHVPTVITALRLAAMLEDFGKLPGALLGKNGDGTWQAAIGRESRRPTPIEAMRAAIDAAKPPKASGVVQSHIDAFLATLSYSQRQSFEQAKLEDAVALRDAAKHKHRFTDNGWRTYIDHYERDCLDCSFVDLADRLVAAPGPRDTIWGAEKGSLDD